MAGLRWWHYLLGVGALGGLCFLAMVFRRIEDLTLLPAIALTSLGVLLYAGCSDVVFAFDGFRRVRAGGPAPTFARSLAWAFGALLFWSLCGFAVYRLAGDRSAVFGPVVWLCLGVGLGFYKLAYHILRGALLRVLSNSLKSAAPPPTRS